MKEEEDDDEEGEEEDEEKEKANEEKVKKEKGGNEKEKGEKEGKKDDQEGDKSDSTELGGEEDSLETESNNPHLLRITHHKYALRDREMKSSQTLKIPLLF